MIFISAGVNAIKNIKHRDSCVFSSPIATAVLLTSLFSDMIKMLIVAIIIFSCKGCECPIYELRNLGFSFLKGY